MVAYYDIFVSFTTSEFIIIIIISNAAIRRVREILPSSALLFFWINDILTFLFYCLNLENGNWHDPAQCTQTQLITFTHS